MKTVRVWFAFLLVFAATANAQVRIPGPGGGAPVVVPTPDFYHSFNNDAGTGTTATANNGSNCTSITATWVEDPAASGHHALVFDGTSGKVANCGTALDALNDFTLSIWMKAVGYGAAGVGALMTKAGATNQLRSWVFRLDDATDSFLIRIGDTSATQLYDTFAGPADSMDAYMGTSTWVHLAAVVVGCTAMACNPTLTKLYINGAAVLTTQTEDNTGTRRSDGGDTVRIGGQSGTGLYFNGDLDEPKAWASALSDAQIAAVYAAGRP